MLTFWKMHGLGNDFVIIDSRKTRIIPDKIMVRRIADRRLGIGCDQIIFLVPPTSPNADISLNMFNADGSSLEACGNATRCVARLLLDETGHDRGVVQTVAGLLQVWKIVGSNGEIRYAVDFAEPQFVWDKIPLAATQDTLRLDLQVGPLREPCAVNVGNPHAVFFVDDVEAIDLATYGPQIETHPLFPARTNVEICQILAPGRIRMRVWERGCGITPACGSGAVASLVAAVRRGLAARTAEIVLDGGTLAVEWRDDNHAILSGPASLAASGILAEELLCA